MVRTPQWIKRLGIRIRQAIYILRHNFIHVVVVVFLLSLFCFITLNAISNNTVPKMGQVNLENMKYAHLAIALDEFLFSSKEVKANLEYWVCDEIAENFPDSEISIKTEPFFPESNYRYPANPRTLLKIPVQVTITSEYWKPSDDREFYIPVRGKEFFFPFDSYSVRLGVSIPVDNEIYFKDTQFPYEDSGNVPFAFSVVQNLRGYKVTVVAINNNSISITVHRSFFDKVLFIISVMILFSIGIYFVYTSFRSKDINFPLIISGVALLIALPSLRTALVPTQIQIRTIVDIALFVPLLMFVYGFFTAVIRILLKQKQEQ